MKQFFETVFSVNKMLGLMREKGIKKNKTDRRGKKNDLLNKRWVDKTSKLLQKEK